ncbi:MAG: Rieske 2Fe-2S domain-containing protein [Candidatus Omnitrophica bacterium]|nr:Rieske 2Fe-2S domain-containing protein [Candidatus Omnitrophota bacterium]
MTNKNDKTEQLQPTEPAPRIQRRRFLERLSVALGVVAGAVLAVPGFGFIFSPLWRKTPRVWRYIGRLEEFKVGQTVNVAFLDSSPLPWAGVTARTAAWLRRESEDKFIAFAVNCSHLGCPVRWLPKANLFMCPCHGGVYYSDGRVAAGPPPRPLTRFSVRVRNGGVEIETGPIPIT